MEIKRSRPRALRVTLVMFALLVAGFAALLQSRTASADRTELVVGLQNDMTTLNFFNPEANTVWGLYQVGWNFESLFATDPDLALYAVLANDSVTGSHSSTKGYDIRTDLNPNGTIVDVFIRGGVKFHDNVAMTADDVVFSYQTMVWSTEQTVLTPLFWPAPKAPLWNGTGMSRVGVEKINPTTVRFYMYTPFALFYQGTLGASIIPQHIWQNHLNPAQQIDLTRPPNPVTDTFDRSIDFSYGSNSADIPSTYGTGMFKLDSWTRNVGSRISVYDNYWGKSFSHTWKTVSYSFFPEHLRSIRFVIYTSLDVISLALQKGDIDTLIWPLTPGFLSQIKYNPAIGVEQVSDRGYFYLSFNLRRKPWNDLNLRKAISMAIDKNYIVNTLMGGFGSPGTVPVSTHLSQYVNASAVPPGFDLVGAADLLNRSGMIDRNGDGFRDYTDGSPIKATILTPPKDYDPIRADAGIMISNNLKKIGLNIDAAPTSFDTIVAKAFTQVDFDIYVLGWSLGDFPELYLKDFFACSQDAAINPAGQNSAGYCNPQVDAWITQMLKTIDTTTRIQIIKNIEGRVTNDIPWNVLYYRKNLNAFRNDRWVGWVNTPPLIYNFWSLSKLAPAGAVVVPPPAGALTVAMTIPERVLANHAVAVDAYVSQDLAPVKGATVYVNATTGDGASMVNWSQLQGTTDVTGHAQFAWTTPVVQGSLVVTATAWSGTASGVDTKLISVTPGPPPPMAQLRLSTTTPVIGTGGTATINARVTDGQGGPISNVAVRIDTTLLLGTITPSTGTTNSQGNATFTYRAPATAAKFPNQHLADIVKADMTVPNTIAVDTQHASIVIFVENDNAPDWSIVDIQGAPVPVLNLLVPGSTVAVSVKVTDYTGAAKQAVPVEAVLPAGETNVTVTTPNPATTDATGSASFTFGHSASTTEREVPIRFQVVTPAAQVTDEMELLLSNMTTRGYGAVLDLSPRTLSSAPTPDTSTVTATVYDQTGTPAVGAAVIFQVPYSPLGLPAQIPFVYDYVTPAYSGRGLDMNSFGLGSLGPAFQSSAGQGTPYGVENFLEDYEVLGDTANLNGTYIDSCNPAGNPDPTVGTDPWPSDFSGTYVLNATGLTNAAGQVSAPFYADPNRIDNGMQLRAYVGDGSGANRLHVEADACNFVAFVRKAAFVIDTGFIVRRAPVFAMGSASFDRTVLTSLNRFANVTATFYTRTGPAANDQVFLLRGLGSATRNVGNARTTRASRSPFYGTLSTNATGVLRWEVAEQFTRVRIAGVTVDVAPLSLSQAIFFSALPADPRYAFGSRDQLFSGDYGDYFFSPNFEVLLAKIPFEFTIGYLAVPSTVAFAQASVADALLPEAGTTSATVTVTTGTGVAIANAAVYSGPVQGITDATGHATLPFKATALGAIESLVVVQTTDNQVLRAWFGVVVTHPVLSVTAISVDAKPAGQASTISVTVQNQLAVSGPATVVISVGGTPVVAQVLTIDASATKTVKVDYVFASAGSYTVSSGGVDKSVDIAAAPGPDLTTAIGLGVGLLIVGLVVGVILGRVMMGRKKPPTEAPIAEAPMAEEEIPATTEAESK